MAEGVGGGIPAIPVFTTIDCVIPCSCCLNFSNTMARTIYLDFNATTPLDAGVRDAMLPFLDRFWGNPSSVHRVGREARAALDDFRYRMAEMWRCKPSEVVFTSGGTESNNLAVFGIAHLLKSKGRHLVVSSVEHPAVLSSFEVLEKQEGYEVTRLPVDAEGRVSVESVVRALRSDTTLVAVMAANNEVGTRQPVEEIGRVCRERGIKFHTDAVQVFGKDPFLGMSAFEADSVAVCAHKFHGPKGVGALFIRSPLLPVPHHVGGAHENERRAGTENLAGIAGLVAAFERFVMSPVFDSDRILPLSKRLADGLRAVPGVTQRGHPTDRLSNTVSFTVRGCDSMSLMAGLDLEGVCASSGSACAAGSLEPSHVLKAMGVGDSEANALVRFSLGRDTTLEEIERVIEVVPAVVRRIRG